MFELLRKTYQLEVLWQTCTYEQFSMYECLEFSYMIQQKDFKIEDWIYNFLKDKIEIKPTDLINIDLDKFMKVLFDTAFKGFFSDKKDKKEAKDWMPFEAYIMFLAEKFSLNPDDLVKKYTPEQINYYTEWIIYNLNEQTEEGQKRNKINKEMKEYKNSIDEDKEKEELKELLKKMDLKSNLKSKKK